MWLFYYLFRMSTFITICQIAIFLLQKEYQTFFAIILCSSRFRHFLKIENRQISLFFASEQKAKKTSNYSNYKAQKHVFIINNFNFYHSVIKSWKRNFHIAKVRLWLQYEARRPCCNRNSKGYNCRINRSVFHLRLCSPLS